MESKLVKRRWMFFEMGSFGHSHSIDQDGVGLQTGWKMCKVIRCKVICEGLQRAIVKRAIKHLLSHRDD